MAYSHVEALKECYVWDESEQDWYMETVWEGDDPYDGDTDTHNAYYLTDVNDEHSGIPIDSSVPLDCYIDGSDTFFVYDLNGAWVDHSLHQLYQANVSSWHFNDDYKTHIEPHDLAPGDTTNKLTINGQEIDIQIGDCIIFYDSNKKISDCFGFLANDALHNFTRYNYDIDPEQTYTSKQPSYRAAWYIAPGVWSDVSGANDPKHRILLGNDYVVSYVNPEDNYVDNRIAHSDFKVVLPRFVIEPENIQPGDMIDKITINTTEVQLKPGDYLNTKINLDGYRYTNSNSTTYSNTWPEEIMLYISPGMLVPIHIQQTASEMHASDLQDALPFEYELPAKSHVQLKWTDPPDLPDWDPYPCTWEGTVIVRKEDSPPLHRWDGEKIVRTTTRNKYKTKPYKDENIVSGKTYYYAFMPYYTRYEDPDHPIRFYTFTKVIKVEIGDKSLSSTIDSIDVDGTDATINYTLSQPDGGSFTSIKMYGKIGKNPKCDNTDDVVEDVDSSSTTLSLTGLEPESTYYFCLVTMDTNNKKLSSNVMSCNIGEEPDRMLINLNPSNRTAWIASTNTTSTNFITRYSPDSLFPEGKNIVYSTGLNELICEIEVTYDIELYTYEWIDQYYFEMLAYNQIYVDGAWTGTYSRFKYYLIDPNVDYFLSITQPQTTLHSNVVESAINSTYGTKMNITKDNQLHKVTIKLIYQNTQNRCSAGTIIRLANVKYYLDDTMIGSIILSSTAGQYVITGGIVTNRTGYEMAGINNYLRFYSNLSDIYTRTDLSSLQDIKMNYFYNAIEYLDKDNVFTVLKDDPFILNYLKRPNSFGLGPISSERAFTSLIEKPGIDFANYLQEIIDGSTAYDSEYTVFSDDVLTITILNMPSSSSMQIRVFSNKSVIPERSDSLDQSTTVSIGEYNYYKETLHDTMYIYAVLYTFPNARMSQIEFIFDTPASSSPTGRSSSARLPVTGMSRSLDNPFCSPDPRYTTEYNKGNKNISRPLCTSLYEYYHPHDSYDSGYTLPPNQYDIIKSFKLKIKNEYEDRFVDKTTVLLDYLNGIKHEIFDSFYVKNDGWSLNVTSAGKPYLWATSVYKDYWTGTIAPAGVIIKIKPNSIMYLYAILEMVKSPNYNYTQFVGLGWYRLTKSTTEEDTYYIRSGDYQIRDGSIYPTDQFCGNPMPTSDKRVVMEYMHRNYSQTEPIYLIPNISMDTQPLMGKMTANALQFYVIKMALVGDVEFVHGTVKHS